MATATLKTDEWHDVYLPDGKNLLVESGAAACLQSIRQATLMRLGEDTYNTLKGVDYLGTVFTSQPDYDLARQSIADAILSCPDVIGIESLTTSVSGESFNYEALVNTTYGPIPVSTK